MGRSDDLEDREREAMMKLIHFTLLSPFLTPQPPSPLLLTPPHGPLLHWNPGEGRVLGGYRTLMGGDFFVHHKVNFAWPGWHFVDWRWSRSGR